MCRCQRSTLLHLPTFQHPRGPSIPMYSISTTMPQESPERRLSQIAADPSALSQEPRTDLVWRRSAPPSLTGTTNVYLRDAWTTTSAKKIWSSAASSLTAVGNHHLPI